MVLLVEDVVQEADRAALAQTVQLSSQFENDPDVRQLIAEYPIGRQLRFRGYHPAI